MATGQNLIDRVRQNADIVGADVVVPDTTILQWINDDAAWFYEKIVSKFEDVYTEPTTITIASGASTYSMSGIWKVRKIERLVDGSTTEYRRVHRVSLDEAHKTTRRLYRYGSTRVRYHITGSAIYFTPVEDAPATYRLWSVPTYTTLTTSGTAVDQDNGMIEFAVIGATIKALIRQERDASDWRVRFAELKQRLDEEVPERDMAEPFITVDNRRESDDLADEVWGATWD